VSGVDGASDTVRVVVVDDQALVRTGFAMILSAEDGIDVVGEAGDGQEAIEVVRAHQPDVVVMDIRMPVLDGVEATRMLAGPEVSEPVKVLMVTTFDLDEYVYAALQAGASGFLLKDTPAEELVNAVQVIARGDALIAPSVTRRLIEEFTRRAPREPGPTPATLEVLTERELDVLREIARGRSNAEIAATLFVSETTVKTHVGRILMKLHLRDRVQAVVLAYETGLVLPGQS
jgi:DNA-binding NarL/FixJ family response regulator